MAAALQRLEEVSNDLAETIKLVADMEAENAELRKTNEENKEKINGFGEQIVGQSIKIGKLRTRLENSKKFCDGLKKSITEEVSSMRPYGLAFKDKKYTTIVEFDPSVKDVLKTMYGKTRNTTAEQNP